MKSIMLKTFSVLIVLSLFVFSCKKESDKTEMIDHHTSELSLDWDGTYSGTLPCADCEGIETSLTLNKDLSYVLTIQYLGKENVLTDTLKGNFTWDGNNIKLDGIAENDRPSEYKIEENQIKQLDMAGNEITGDLAKKYILKKKW